MFIEEECAGSDDEDGDGGYHSGTDGDIDVAGADGGYVDDGGIFVSEGDANATDPTHVGLALRDHNHRVSGDRRGYAHEPRLGLRYVSLVLGLLWSELV